MLSGNKQCRVLSIQSHVVSGYVGNKAATFPLQVLGFEVDAINSVQFSNHTGYKQMKGQVLNSVELRDLYEGLKANEIHHYSHLLTGYVGSESFLKEVLNVIKALKETNPNLVYVCDPVLGDNGKFYVPECLVPIYRDELLPFADLITPNQFEAELLSEIKIHNEKDAFKAIDILHKKGVKTVVISSLEFGNSDQLILLASIIKEKQSRCIKLTFPKLNAIFTGTGDLFHSMLLAWLHRDNYDIKTACEKTVSAMHVILERTLECAQELAGAGNTPNPHQRELKLIQSLDDIRHPQDLYKAEEVTPPDISS